MLWRPRRSLSSYSSKPHKIPVVFECKNSRFSKGLLLPSKCTPFALQKDSFCLSNVILLQPKRTPFEIHVKFA